jgi:cyclic beta-1,2-glucan synthetase
MWMGWERKRGKLAELNRFLLGDRAHEGVHAGDLTLLDSVAFVISLDADTLMPAGSAATLIGTLAHPLNASFTVLQPRMKARPSASGVTFFDTWFPITAGLSVNAGVFWSCRYDIQEVYSALFGDCLYCGKGIYHARRFHESICLPDNAVLSHDHIEGMHGRAGLASDVVLLETYSANLLSHLHAYHRWTRGDWQLLPWLLGTVPPGDCSARLSFSDRWRLFENLRWTLLPIATFAAIAASWLSLSSHAPGITIALLLGYTNQVFLQPLASLSRAALGKTSWHRAILEAIEAFTRHVVRAVMVVAFLPYEVVVIIDAVGRALYRMARNRRKLLEWKPMAQTGRAISSRLTPLFAWREMFTGTLIVLLLAVLAGYEGQTSWIVIPLLVLWFIAPQIAYWTGIPLRRSSRQESAREPAE